MNWLEKTSEKISKKQIIALAGMWILKEIIDAPPIVKAVCITLIAFVAIICQWNLDKEKPNAEENTDIDTPGPVG